MVRGTSVSPALDHIRGSLSHIRGRVGKQNSHASVNPVPHIRGSLGHIRGRVGKQISHASVRAAARGASCGMQGGATGTRGRRSSALDSRLGARVNIGGSVIGASMRYRQAAQCVGESTSFRLPRIFCSALRCSIAFGERQLRCCESVGESASFRLPRILCSALRCSIAFGERQL